jgi:hypothetical protein
LYGEIEKLIVEKQEKALLETEFAIGFTQYYRLFDSSSCLPLLVSLIVDPASIEPIQMSACGAILFIGAVYLRADEIERLLKFYRSGSYSVQVGEIVLTALGRSQSESKSAPIT